MKAIDYTIYMQELLHSMKEGLNEEELIALDKKHKKSLAVREYMVGPQAIDYYNSKDNLYRNLIIIKRTDLFNNFGSYKHRMETKLSNFFVNPLILTVPIFIYMLLAIIPYIYGFRDINYFWIVSSIYAIFTVFIFFPLVIYQANIREFFEEKADSTNDNGDEIYNKDYIQFLSIVKKTFENDFNDYITYSTFLDKESKISHELFSLVKNYAMDSFLKADSMENYEVTRSILTPMMEDLLEKVREVYDKDIKEELDFIEDQNSKLKDEAELDISTYIKNNRKENYNGK